MKNQYTQWLLRYVIFAVGPYLITKSLEQFIIKDPETDKKLKTLNKKYNYIFSNFPGKCAVFSAIIATLLPKKADILAKNLIQIFPLINFSKKLSKKLRKADTDSLKEIIFNKHFSQLEKLKLLRKRGQRILQKLKGPNKKAQFLLYFSALLFFFFNNKLSKYENLTPEFESAVIELFHEYNAPLPEELIRKIS